MSPFAHYLHELRLKHGIRQTELAELLGYEQSYISALEIGTKGPPTPEFLAKLARAFEMDDPERRELEQIAEASQRKLALDTESPQGLYWMLYELRQHVDKLHPAQVQMNPRAVADARVCARDNHRRPRPDGGARPAQALPARHRPRCVGLCIAWNLGPIDTPADWLNSRRGMSKGHPRATRW